MLILTSVQPPLPSSFHPLSHDLQLHWSSFFSAQLVRSMLHCRMQRSGTVYEVPRGRSAWETNLPISGCKQLIWSCCPAVTLLTQLSKRLMQSPASQAPLHTISPRSWCHPGLEQRGLCTSRTCSRTSPARTCQWCRTAARHGKTSAFSIRLSAQSDG